MANSYDEYISRIQKVVKHIDENIDKALDLNSLAGAAYFSPFHFHRIFTSLMNETPMEFVNRLRLEKSALMLINSQSVSVTEISMKCGFSSPAVFSRSFKNYFSISPSQYRREPVKISKIRKPDSKKRKAAVIKPDYISDALNKLKKNSGRVKMDIEVKELDEIPVAYVATLNGYVNEHISKAWDKLCSWAGARGLLNKETKYIGISFDDPDITPADKCRYYACVNIPEGTETTNGVDKTEIKAGKYAVYHFDGQEEQIKEAYKDIYKNWLPTSGYQPADHPCLEHYLEEPAGKHFVMDIYVPVVPL